MKTTSKIGRALTITLAALVALTLASSASAKKFADSDDAKEKDEPQKFLADYDKLVDGEEADWVSFSGTDLKSFKSVNLKTFGTTRKGSEARDAAEDGVDYLTQWLEDSKLGWKIVKSGGELTIEGNVYTAWEPSGAARAWGGWAASPGVGIELLGKDKSGKVVFQVRHKSKGSSLRDAVENGLEDIVKTLELGK